MSKVKTQQKEVKEAKEEEEEEEYFSKVFAAHLAALARNYISNGEGKRRPNKKIIQSDSSWPVHYFPNRKS